MNSNATDRLLLSRQDIAEAVHYWGEHGVGGDEISLTRQASKLVDVLATMDHHHETEISIPSNSERGQLVAVFLEQRHTERSSPAP